MLRASPPPARHPWKFFRTGGLDQVAIETPEDILALPTLDQKLWVALSCPTKGVDLEERTLALLDTDHDGRIRVREVLEAIEWAATRLKRPGDLLEQRPTLKLSEINDTAPEDRVLVASAREILKRLGKPEADELAPEDFKKPELIFPATSLNGDNVLAASETDDPDVQALIKDILTCVGGEKDRSGADGVTPEKAAAFFEQLQSYLDWVAKSADKDIAVLGERTAAACAALTTIRPKVEDFFARCRLAAFDPRAIAALNRQENEFLAIAAKDLKVTGEEIAGFPLARVTARAVLPLFEGSNPAWASILNALHRDAVVPIFGADKTTLTLEEWQELNAKLSPYETWLGKKTGICIEQLGIDRAKELLNGTARQKLSALFTADQQLQPHFEAIASVERLVHYHRDLRTLMHNFINFSDLYSRDRWAIFQAGKLYLDARACELCVRVDDPNAHATLAVMSKAYIAYCDCRQGDKVIKIAACFTQGDSDYLFVGRNGIFYDRHGGDWHATITKIIDNPISLREAFWAPYKKVLRAVEEQVAKRAAAAETASVSNLTTAAMTAATPAPAGATTAPPPPPPTPAAVHPPKRMDLSSIIGLSVALGSIGTFLATIFAKFVDLPWWEIPIVLVGLMLVISLPSVLIAWMKLRQRNLGPILEANGWAINGRVKINVPFGTALTERARLPAGSRRVMQDPYEDKAAQRRRVVTVLVLLLIIAAGVVWSARHRGYWSRFKQTIETRANQGTSTAPTKP